MMVMGSLANSGFWDARPVVSVSLGHKNKFGDNDGLAIEWQIGGKTRGGNGGKWKCADGSSQNPPPSADQPVDSGR
jgi:hypothetical protein